MPKVTLGTVLKTLHVTPAADSVPSVPGTVFPSTVTSS